MKKWMLGMAALALAVQVQAADIQVHMAKARASLPGVPNSAAFMTLQNAESEAVELVSAESDIAKSVELHTHKMIDGKMAMRQVPFIEVPAKGKVELKPGGYHIMFIGLNEPLAEGEQVDLTLVFGDGQRMDLQVPVKKIHVGMKH